MTSRSDHDITITTLLSIGEHPLSGRARRAEEDARAVEVMLQYAPASVNALHIGAAEDENNSAVLRDYLGMGLPAIEVIATSPNTDANAALLQYFKNDNATLPHIVLTGTRSEIGESSGCLPYVLADQLNIPFIPNICNILSIDVSAGYAQVMQSLPRGQRRKIKIPLPFIASVGMAAPTPRQSSFGLARRGILEIITSISTTHDIQQNTWHTEPARKRPKRLKVIKAKTAAERFKAATAKVQSTGGEKIYDVNTATDAIITMLKKEKVL